MNVNATLLGQAIAFVLFVLFCMRHVWPPLLAAIEARQKTISDGLTAAQEAKTALQSAQSEKTAQLQAAKQQAQAILDQANKQRAQIIEEAKADALKERSKILTQSQADAERVCQREYENCRQQFGKLVILAAEKVVKNTLDNETNQRIIEELVAEL
ncbi:MAG: F0F1 ATP synthase subunit B [Candidatus Symbiodolus clandestinus]